MSSKSRTLKTRTFQKISYFPKSCTFEKLDFQNLVLSKSRTFQNLALFKNSIFKSSYFQNRVLSKLVLFTEFRAFFKTSVFLKIPRSKFISNSPTKIPCFFQKFPVQKKVDFTNSVFFSENSVFYKIPRFSDFLNL